MSRYDSRTTTFSPEGRLFQVEYAVKAIDNAGASVGILAKDGVIIAAEKRIESKLLAPTKSSDKLIKIDEHVACAVAGLTSDANILVSYLRRVAQMHRLTYQEPQPLVQLIQRVCDLKQGYTQFGGQRPFGVSFLFAAWDEHEGFQLFRSDPSGNYDGWKATSMGKNNQAGTTLMKSDYKDECTVDEALELALKVLCKTMDTTSPTAEKVEFLVLKHDANGNPIQTLLKESEIKELIKKYEAEANTGGDE